MKQLSLNEMLDLKGGISREEYCELVDQLIDDNWDSWSPEQKKAATVAYSKHC